MTSIVRLVNGIASKYQGDREMLIQILLDLQKGVGWLPEEVLNEVSRQLEVPLSQIYQIASFYKAFSFAPRGRHTIRVCLGTACQIRGAPLILDRLQQVLEVGIGDTTPDMKFTLETVNCPGCCALGPMLTVDGDYHGHLEARDAEQVLSKYR